MMNKEEKESLEAIRFKIEHNQTDFNKQEVLHLGVVYSYVSRYAGKERILKTDCQGCLLTAMNVVSNYIKFYEQIDNTLNNVISVINKEVPKQEVRKGRREDIIVELSEKENPNISINQLKRDKLTLKQLREQYPHIKSNSVRGFLEKLEQWQNTNT